MTLYDQKNLNKQKYKHTIKPNKLETPHYPA